jgi:hypothetical protein
MRQRDRHSAPTLTSFFFLPLTNDLLVFPTIQYIADYNWDFLLARLLVTKKLVSVAWAINEIVLDRRARWARRGLRGQEAIHQRPDKRERVIIFYLFMREKKLALGLGVVKLAALFSWEASYCSAACAAAELQSAERASAWWAWAWPPLRNPLFPRAFLTIYLSLSVATTPGRQSSKCKCNFAS